MPSAVFHKLAAELLESATYLRRPVEDRLVATRSFSWTRKAHTIHFRNPLGIAGGFDKDGVMIAGWKHFGAGFVEIGTVTPELQLANPGKTFGRDVETEALWNRMGFPSRGSRSVRSALRDWRFDERGNQEIGQELEQGPEVKGSERFPVFVNIGKQRETPLELASQDYVKLIELFCEPSRTSDPLADAFVINISSPNTKGLRDLFARDRLTEFLQPIAEKLRQHKIPGLLKLSPDLEDQDLVSAVETALELDLDGFVTTNTTVFRPQGCAFPQEGGLSGGPLREKSRDALTKLISILGPRREGLLIVSAGGVLDGAEARKRLEMGADLVQTYSGLVFTGPLFFEDTLRELST
jgi:dihydroorotate dehydrogenase